MIKNLPSFFNQKMQQTTNNKREFMYSRFLFHKKIHYWNLLKKKITIIKRKKFFKMFIDGILWFYWNAVGMSCMLDKSYVCNHILIEFFFWNFFLKNNQAFIKIFFWFGISIWFIFLYFKWKYFFESSNYYFKVCTS